MTTNKPETEGGDLGIPTQETTTGTPKGKNLFDQGLPSPEVLKVIEEMRHLDPNANPHLRRLQQYTLEKKRKVKKDQLGVYIPKTLNEKFASTCKKMGKTKSDVITDFLMDFLNVKESELELEKDK